MKLRFEIVDTHHPEWRGQRFSAEDRARRELAHAHPAGRFILKDRATGAVLDGRELAPEEDPEECEILCEIDGTASGERIGTCPADGRPIFRSHFAGTIYHTTEDR